MIPARAEDVYNALAGQADALLPDTTRRDDLIRRFVTALPVKTLQNDPNDLPPTWQGLLCADGGEMIALVTWAGNIENIMSSVGRCRAGDGISRWSIGTTCRRSRAKPSGRRARKFLCMKRW